MDVVYSRQVLDSIENIQKPWRIIQFLMAELKRRRVKCVIRQAKETKPEVSLRTIISF